MTGLRTEMQERLFQIVVNLRRVITSWELNSADMDGSAGEQELVKEVDGAPAMMAVMKVLFHSMLQVFHQTTEKRHLNI